LEFIDLLLAHNTYLSPVAENIEAGVQGPNKTQRESEADHEWIVSTLHPVGRNLAVYLHQIIPSGKLPW
jgi:hypothetical protein